MKTTLCLGVLLTLGVFQTAHAHRDLRHRNEPHVIVYEDADYRGGSLTLYPGDRIDNLNDARFDNGKKLNDQISSVRLMNGAEILLFDDYDMRGQVLRTASNIRNLAHRDQPDTRYSWNDRVSSLRVSGRGHGSGGSHRPPSVSNPDRMIKQAYLDILGRPVDRDGLSYYRGLVIDQGWTKRMVKNHLRESKEYRGESVDRIIRRAYQDILKRDPDSSGLANYRRLMNQKEWTEQDVRRDLRRSDEYKNRH